MVNIKQLLRLLILLEILFRGLSVIMFYLYRPYDAHSKLAEIVEQLPASIPILSGMGELVLFVFLLGGVTIWLIGAVGVFFSFFWGRAVYMVSVILGVVSGMLVGPFIMTGISFQFEMLGSMASGAVILMLYVGPIAHEFTGKNNNMK